MSVFLDACTVIYRVEAVFPFNARFETLWRQLAEEGHGNVLAVSRLTLLECRVKPLRDGNDALLAKYDGLFMADGIAITELDAPVIELATRLRARHGLRTPDALQAASCLVHQPGAPFVTADASFQRVAGLNVRLLIPS